ncbi:hypothetical protein PHLGIDRAFT_29862 [Phlebiopsis gigantea 11061_1 CR5-6]|uniref:Cytochrome P450 n=1 Tax=Phlebiopsis gigantea (strain 11061_1 CR5-6) TaxID=745531 RepID=A0A0C3SBC9_PHLG1|nr:hypothetical protein PHLGIDRAFT_29862 [Phlebiopsis gigantea 11061_1 CR5-6]
MKPYGPEWRDGRKAFQRVFHPNTVSRFRPREVVEARKLLCRLLRAPDDFMAHLRLTTGSLSLSIAYGIETQEENDPYIMHAERTLEAANAAMVPGAFLVDVFPALKYIPEWMPGASFKTKARIWKYSSLWTLNTPWEVVKRRMTLIQDLIEPATNPAYMESVCKSAVGSIYVGNSTLGILYSFFLAMVCYPEIQHRAQTSIDVVCRGRLPDFSDYDSLPYVHAIVKECLRWHPVMPLNVPHRLSEDDVYDGYYIPEGSFVIANTWALLHDPDVYTEPESFIPERFLTQHETANGQMLVINPDIRDPMEAAFGFGRRICPGRHMAHESMWIVFVSVLATFDIQRIRDVDGAEIVPPEAYSEGFISHPRPFTCRIVPRSPEHADMIRDLEGKS